MRCDFCGEDIEGVPFQKDGMNFCSLECYDAMETGEAIPLGEEILDDPDDYDEEDLDEEIDDDDEDEDGLYDDDDDDEYMDDDDMADDDDRY